MEVKFGINFQIYHGGAKESAGKEDGMIRLENITKEYDNRMILNNISCEFTDSRISAIIAPNGEGKTTLLNIISGITEPDHGKVTQEGHPHHTDVDMIQAGDKNLYFKNTVKENLYYFCAIRGMSTRQTERALEEWKQDFPLYESVKSITVEKLSYGQKRLVALFSSVLSGVSCLLLDEITEGLDSEHVNLVKRLLLKSKNGKTIIIASHDYDFTMDVSDDIYFLHAGKMEQHPQCLDLKSFERIYAEYYPSKKEQKNAGKYLLGNQNGTVRRSPLPIWNHLRHPYLSDPDDILHFFQYRTDIRQRVSIR